VFRRILTLNKLKKEIDFHKMTLNQRIKIKKETSNPEELALKEFKI
jgi:hypothetical protein